MGLSFRDGSSERAPESEAPYHYTLSPDRPYRYNDKKKTELCMKPHHTRLLANYGPEAVVLGASEGIGRAFAEELDKL